MYYGQYTLQIVYSVIDANEDESCSESVDVFFDGNNVRSVDNRKKCDSQQTGVYDNCIYEMTNSERFGKKTMKMSPIVTDM